GPWAGRWAARLAQAEGRGDGGREAALAQGGGGGQADRRAEARGREGRGPGLLPRRQAPRRLPVPAVAGGPRGGQAAGAVPQGPAGPPRGVGGRVRRAARPLAGGPGAGAAAQEGRG